MNLLEIPMFDVLRTDGTTQSINAVQAIRDSKSIVDFVDNHRQNIVSVRFLASLVSRFNITDPSQSFEATMPLDVDVNALRNEEQWRSKEDGEKQWAIGHIVEELASGTYPSFRRGVVKPLDDLSPTICTTCVAKTVLRKTLFTLACGVGNAGWVYPNTGVYAHPLGNNLWQTLQMCNFTPSPHLWWEKSSLAQGEAFWMSFAPNKFVFNWVDGDCYLCGAKGKVTSTLDKAVYVVKRVHELLNEHVEPMLLLSTPKVKYNEMRGYFINFSADNFHKLSPDSGRLIREALNDGCSKFRYAALIAENGKIVGENSGVIDLLAPKLTIMPEIKPQPDFRFLAGLLNKIYLLPQRQLEAVKDGIFTSKDAMEAIEATIWKHPKRTPLKMLLLQLYANYPQRGFNVPDISSTNDFVAVVKKQRKDNKPIDWFKFACVLANKLD